MVQLEERYSPDDLTKLTIDIKLNRSHYSNENLSALVECGIQNLMENDVAFARELKRRGITYKTLNVDDTEGTAHYKMMLRAIKRIRFFGYIWLSGSTANREEKFLIFCPRHGVSDSEFNLDKLAGGVKTHRNEGGMRCCSTQRQSVNTLYTTLCDQLSYKPEPTWTQAERERLDRLERACLLYEDLKGKFDDPSVFCDEIKKVEPANLEKVSDSIPSPTRNASATIWGRACVITGKTKNVELHHMYMTAYWPCLKDEGLNCIPIHRRFHTIIHDLYYDYEDNIHLPVTGGDFILFLKTLIDFWKFQLSQMETGQRPRGSEDYLRSMIKKCQLLLPRIEDADKKISALIKKDQDEQRSRLLAFNKENRKDSRLENFHEN